MAWAEVHWKSEILGKETTMQVLTPQVGVPPYPTLYLLHSLNDDSYAWLRKTRVESLVRSLPLVVVMPDGYRGFFTDNEEGPPYARHVGEEVVSFVERTFPVRSDRRARAIGGASMGGYGALRIGLGYSDRFCSIHSHSGSLDRSVEFMLNPADRTGIIKHRPDSFIFEMRRIFGERPNGTKHDVLKLALEAKQNGTLPALWIDCGTKDYLLEGTRAFHHELEVAKVPHVYHEFPGSHDWEYANQHIEAALGFHTANLRIAPSSAK